MFQGCYLHKDKVEEKKLLLAHLEVAEYAARWERKAEGRMDKGRKEDEGR